MDTVEITAKEVQGWFKFATLLRVDVKDSGQLQEWQGVMNHYVPVPHPTPEDWFDGAINLAKLYGLVPSRESEGVAILGPCMGPENTLTVFLFLEGAPGSPLETRGSMRTTIMRSDEEDWKATLRRVNKSYTVRV